jgi:hypothetical protein
MQTKINKETLQLNDTTGQMNLIHTYIIFQPTATEYTFFPAAYGLFCEINHIFTGKVRKNLKVKILKNIFSANRNRKQAGVLYSYLTKQTLTQY